MDARSRRGSWALVWVVVLVYGGLVLRTSWLSDDAYISLRMVDNLISGLGWTWNPGERVLAGTNPLWMLALAPLMALTGEEFYAALILGWACSLGSVLLLLRLAAGPTSALLAVSVLAMSRSMVDYATSGLENPLTWLLLLLFVGAWVAEDRGPRTLATLGALAALGMINRMDSALLFAPAIAARLWRHRGGGALGWLAIGGLPFLVWVLFSLFYYGFPFPNTAYAKLGAQLDATILLSKGLAYYRWTLANDPVTFLALIGASLLALWGARSAWPLVLGAALYLLYTLKIGGDFMGGRFFGAPLLLTVAAAVRAEPPRRPALVLAPILLLGAPFGVMAAFASFGDAQSFLAQGTSRRDALVESGVADERLWHSQQHALFSADRRAREQRRRNARRGLQEVREDGVTAVAVRATVGRSAFTAGPDLHIIDVLALGDPLLARLPALGFAPLRVGHYIRVLPRGYVESVETGEDRLEDRQVAELYQRLSLVTRGPLLDRQRLAEIWRFNTGQNDGLVDVELYRNPPQDRISLKALRLERRRVGGHPFWPTGVVVELGARQRSPRVQIELSAAHDFHVEFRLGARSLGRVKVRMQRAAGGGLVVHDVETPQRALRGFDTIVVSPVDLYTDQRHVIGNLLLHDVRERVLEVAMGASAYSGQTE